VRSTLLTSPKAKRLNIGGAGVATVKTSTPRHGPVLASLRSIAAEWSGRSQLISLGRLLKQFVAASDGRSISARSLCSTAAAATITATPEKFSPMSARLPTGDTLLQRFEQRTLGLVLAHWRAIETLAIRLIEAGRLDGDQAEQIVTARLPRRDNQAGMISTNSSGIS
jgi:hypothetical protein